MLLCTWYHNHSPFMMESVSSIDEIASTPELSCVDVDGRSYRFCLTKALTPVFLSDDKSGFSTLPDYGMIAKTIDNPCFIQDESVRRITHNFESGYYVIATPG